jgi:hypothetical protein
MLDPNQQSRTMGLVLSDTNRPPGYESRGQTLQINPHILSKSKERDHDRLGIDAMYQFVTTPAVYKRYGIEPAGESPPNDQETPVDVLLHGLQHILLHEVRFTRTSVVPTSPFF